MKNLLLIVLGLIYIISPLDLIPDVVPIVGWLDDLVVLELSVQRGVKMLKGK